MEITLEKAHGGCTPEVPDCRHPPGRAVSRWPSRERFLPACSPILLPAKLPSPMPGLRNPAHEYSIWRQAAAACFWHVQARRD
jgi:hypothetical protein